MDETALLCPAVLRVRPGCPAEPEHALHVPGPDARHRVRAGVRLHLEGRQAHAAEVLKTDLFRLNN